MDAQLPPDLIVVAASLTMFQLTEVVHRHRIGPSISSYSRLPFCHRFDWDRRFLNITFQTLQLIFNLYLIFFDPVVQADCLRAYSNTAHLGFLIIIAFYIYDTTGIVMHPITPPGTSIWIFHHLVATSLLLLNVCYLRTSAFPAAILLISAASHIPNELRWILSALHVQNPKLLRAVFLLRAFLTLLFCGLPPPYLLFRLAAHLDTSIFRLISHHMPSYCIFFFLLIYVPHVVLVFYLFRRVLLLWNARVKPLRISTNPYRTIS